MATTAWDVVLLDATGTFNVLASVSESGLTELIWQAHLSLAVISSVQPHEYVYTIVKGYLGMFSTLYGLNISHLRLS